MAAPKNLPCEMRFYVTEEMRERLKAAAFDRSEPVSTFIRILVVEALERSDRRMQCRSTDSLIEVMAKKIDAMSEKLGVDGGDSAEKKGGEIH